MKAATLAMKFSTRNIMAIRLTPQGQQGASGQSLKSDPFAADVHFGSHSALGPEAGIRAELTASYYHVVQRPI